MSQSRRDYRDLGLTTDQLEAIFFADDPKLALERLECNHSTKALLKFIYNQIELETSTLTDLTYKYSSVRKELASLIQSYHSTTKKNPSALTATEELTVNIANIPHSTNSLKALLAGLGADEAFLSSFDLIHQRNPKTNGLVSVVSNPKTVSRAEIIDTLIAACHADFSHIKPVDSATSQLLTTTLPTSVPYEVSYPHLHLLGLFGITTVQVPDTSFPGKKDFVTLKDSKIINSLDESTINNLERLSESSLPYIDALGLDWSNLKNIALLNRIINIVTKNTLHNLAELVSTHLSLSQTVLDALVSDKIKESEKKEHWALYQEYTTTFGQCPVHFLLNKEQLDIILIKNSTLLKEDPIFIQAYINSLLPLDFDFSVAKATSIAVTQPIIVTSDKEFENIAMKARPELRSIFMFYNQARDIWKVAKNESKGPNSKQIGAFYVTVLATILAFAAKNNIFLIHEFDHFISKNISYKWAQDMSKKSKPDQNALPQKFLTSLNNVSQYAFFNLPDYNNLIRQYLTILFSQASIKSIPSQYAKVMDNTFLTNLFWMTKLAYSQCEINAKLSSTLFNPPKIQGLTFAVDHTEEGKLSIPTFTDTTAVPFTLEKNNSSPITTKDIDSIIKHATKERAAPDLFYKDCHIFEFADSMNRYFTEIQHSAPNQLMSPFQFNKKEVKDKPGTGETFNTVRTLDTIPQSIPIVCQNVKRVTLNFYTIDVVSFYKSRYETLLTQSNKLNKYNHQVDLNEVIQPTDIIQSQFKQFHSTITIDLADYVKDSLTSWNKYILSLHIPQDLSFGQYFVEIVSDNKTALTCTIKHGELFQVNKLDEIGQSFNIFDHQNKNVTQFSGIIIPSLNKLNNTITWSELHNSKTNNSVTIPYNQSDFQHFIIYYQEGQNQLASLVCLNNNVAQTDLTIGVNSSFVPTFSGDTMPSLQHYTTTNPYELNCFYTFLSHELLTDSSLPSSTNDLYDSSFFTVNGVTKNIMSSKQRGVKTPTQLLIRPSLYYRRQLIDAQWVNLSKVSAKITIELLDGDVVEKDVINFDLFKLNGKNDELYSTLEFDIPTNTISTISVAISSTVNDMYPIHSNYHHKLNQIDTTTKMATLLLNRQKNNYYLYAVSKDGGIMTGTEINITLKPSYLNTSLSYRVVTDNEGKVNLGKLLGIHSLEANPSHYLFSSDFAFNATLYNDYVNEYANLNHFGDTAVWDSDIMLMLDNSNEKEVRLPFPFINAFNKAHIALQIALCDKTTAIAPDDKLLDIPSSTFDKIFEYFKSTRLSFIALNNGNQYLCNHAVQYDAATHSISIAYDKLKPKTLYRLSYLGENKMYTTTFHTLSASNTAIIDVSSYGQFFVTPFGIFRCKDHSQLIKPIFTKTITSSKLSVEIANLQPNAEYNLFIFASSFSAHALTATFPKLVRYIHNFTAPTKYATDLIETPTSSVHLHTVRDVISITNGAPQPIPTSPLPPQVPAPVLASPQLVASTSIASSESFNLHSSSSILGSTSFSILPPGTPMAGSSLPPPITTPREGGNFNRPAITNKHHDSSASPALIEDYNTAYDVHLLPKPTLYHVPDLEPRPQYDNFDQFISAYTTTLSSSGTDELFEGLPDISSHTMTSRRGTMALVQQIQSPIDYFTSSYTPLNILNAPLMLSTTFTSSESTANVEFSCPAHSNVMICVQNKVTGDFETTFFDNDLLDARFQPFKTITAFPSSVLHEHTTVDVVIPLAPAEANPAEQRTIFKTIKTTEELYALLKHIVVTARTVPNGETALLDTFAHCFISWQKLTADEKISLYHNHTKFVFTQLQQSDDLFSMFLFFNDREFFERYAREVICDKYHKTVTSLWLLAQPIVTKFLTDFDKTTIHRIQIHRENAQQRLCQLSHNCTNESVFNQILILSVSSRPALKRRALYCLRRLANPNWASETIYTDLVDSIDLLLQHDYMFEAYISPPELTSNHDDKPHIAKILQALDNPANNISWTSFWCDFAVYLACAPIYDVLKIENDYQNLPQTALSETCLVNEFVYSNYSFLSKNVLDTTSRQSDLVFALALTTFNDDLRKIIKHSSLEKEQIPYIVVKKSRIDSEHIYEKNNKFSRLTVPIQLSQHYIDLTATKNLQQSLITIGNDEQNRLIKSDEKAIVYANTHSLKAFNPYICSIIVTNLSEQTIRLKTSDVTLPDGSLPLVLSQNVLEDINIHAGHENNNITTTIVKYLTSETKNALALTLKPYCSHIIFYSFILPPKSLTIDANQTQAISHVFFHRSITLMMLPIPTIIPYSFNVALDNLHIINKGQLYKLYVDDYDSSQANKLSITSTLQHVDPFIKAIEFNLMFGTDEDVLDDLYALFVSGQDDLENDDEDGEDGEDSDDNMSFCMPNRAIQLPMSKYENIFKLLFWRLNTTAIHVFSKDQLDHVNETLSKQGIDIETPYAFFLSRLRFYCSLIFMLKSFIISQPSSTDNLSANAVHTLLGYSLFFLKRMVGDDVLTTAKGQTGKLLITAKEYNVLAFAASIYIRRNFYHQYREFVFTPESYSQHIVNAPSVSHANNDIDSIDLDQPISLLNTHPHKMSPQNYKQLLTQIMVSLSPSITTISSPDASMMLLQYSLFFNKKAFAVKCVKKLLLTYTEIIPNNQFLYMMVFLDISSGGDLAQRLVQNTLPELLTIIQTTLVKICAFTHDLTQTCSGQFIIAKSILTFIIPKICPSNKWFTTFSQAQNYIDSLIESKDIASELRKDTTISITTPEQQIEQPLISLNDPAFELSDISFSTTNCKLTFSIPLFAKKLVNNDDKLTLMFYTLKTADILSYLSVQQKNIAIMIHPHIQFSIDITKSESIPPENGKSTTFSVELPIDVARTNFVQIKYNNCPNQVIQQPFLYSTFNIAVNNIIKPKKISIVNNDFIPPNCIKLIKNPSSYTSDASQFPLLEQQWNKFDVKSYACLRNSELIYLSQNTVDAHGFSPINPQIGVFDNPFNNKDIIKYILYIGSEELNASTICEIFPQ